MMIEILKAAAADILKALENRHVWMSLAIEEVGDQHRRTALGPVWVLINYLLYVLTFVLVFHRGESFGRYGAYVALGTFVWLFVVHILNQSITLFAREENFIKGTRLPLSTYVLKLATHGAIRSAYMILGLALVLLLSGVDFTLYWVASVFGFFIILLSTPAIITVLAFLGAYVPDLQFLIPNILRVGLFLTPVFWLKADGIREILYLWNPFTYYIEIVRMPIIDGVVPYQELVVCGGIGILFWIAAVWVLGRMGRELVFVL